VAIALEGSNPDSSRGGLAGQIGLSRSASHHASNYEVAAELAPGNHELNAASDGELGTSLGGTADSQASSRGEAHGHGPAVKQEPRLVKESFARLISEGPAVMQYFYARLFAANPDCRTLFPSSMTVERERMFAALARLVWSLDNQPGSAEILGQLGRVHRRYGVTSAHYKPFFAALRDTAQHFIGSAWTTETAAAWQAALDYFASTMRAAADEDAKTSPPWRIGEIVLHELRAPGVAVIRLRPSDPLPYQAGQYVPVQVTRWPRAWRNYSIANAPRPGGLIELHVRAVPGGEVSNTLVYHSAVGDCVLLGAADGTMTLADSDRDLLCVAGGTGLAPIKAIIEQALAGQSAAQQVAQSAAPPGESPRKITLFFGARQHFDLYDLDDLQLLESACPALRVLPVLSDEPDYKGLAGTLPDIVGGHGLFEAAEAYICGPPAMVRRTAAVLAASIPPGQIHHDPLP
jgi:NAD(P)H-flavin reductase/hemoglobin-like flavoprotein